MRSDLARLTLLHPGIAAQQEVQEPVAEEEHALQTNEKQNRNVIWGNVHVCNMLYLTMLHMIPRRLAMTRRWTKNFIFSRRVVNIQGIMDMISAL